MSNSFWTVTPLGWIADEDSWLHNDDEGMAICEIEESLDDGHEFRCLRCNEVLNEKYQRDENPKIWPCGNCGNANTPVDLVDAMD